ncbi:glycoside hydrolase [Penicillium canescens]|nr:glycoside hydrolase [Penicillium canescens]
MEFPTKIEGILAQLSLTEKCSLLSGKNMWETLDLPRLGIRSLKTTDGPAGVRGAKWTDGSYTTFVPCGISLGATFDPQVVERIGTVLGAETRGKKAHILLAPTMNLSRSPLGGRNFENFGEDPFLTGIMATHYIKGIQSQGVGACMKHFVANDQETRRFNMDEQIDERTLREVYLRPFQMALKADPWAAMTAYPKINGEHADTSRHLVYEILRKEWGFENLVMSDWGGLNSTIGSIKATTDLEMPGPPLRYGLALEAAVRANEVSEKEDIDPSLRRLLATLDRAGLVSPDKTTEDALVYHDTDVRTGEEVLDRPEFRAIAREAAVSGIVLLKNENSILPLQPTKINKIAIIGPNAKAPTPGGTGSAVVNPYYITTPFESITKAITTLNSEIDIQYEQGIRTHLHLPLLGNIITTPDGKTPGVQVNFYRGHDFEGDIVATTYWQNSMVYLMSDGDIPSNLRGKPYCFRALGLFTPTVSGQYDFSLSNTGKATFFVNNELFIDNREWTNICANFMNCSSPDKLNSMHLEAGITYGFRIDNVAVPPPTRPHDNTLFHRIAGVKVGMLIQTDEELMMKSAIDKAQEADLTIVIAGHNNDTEREGCDRTSLTLPRRTDELIENICQKNPNTVVVTQSACAITMPWAEKARAIVHAWYQGQENGNALADVLLGRFNPSAKLPITFPHQLKDHGSYSWFPGDVVKDRAEYGEGVLVGYRWFDNQKIEPLWPFGYGLSYTSFEITDVQVEGTIAVDGSRNAILSASVTNTGRYAGSEVVQVYMSSSPLIKGEQRVSRSLEGFEKVFLVPGEAKTVRLSLSSHAVSWYEVEGREGGSPAGKWRTDPGVYQCFVGSSSRDIVAELKIVVD